MSKWRPIETAPKDGTQILGFERIRYDEEISETHTYETYWCNRRSHWEGEIPHQPPLRCTPTHWMHLPWMPLPEPPEEETEE